jgi:serine protease Do
MMQRNSRLGTAALGVLTLVGGLLGLANARPTLPIDPLVQEAENKRIAVIAKVRPSVVAIFGPGGNGGGSGVLISEDGFALTNFHVVAGTGITMKCGLPDGLLYDAVLVGLDKVGDVALIKLLPMKEGDKFPHADLGDSDKVQVGEFSLAMGNPFLLATDFTPTVTFGMVSGVHRYQYPDAGNMLEYTDCIQVDTSVNPGNSGGPLFNMNGELIGINGRISLEKRGRVNVGVGYAISINQIKNFLPQLRSGMDTDHASLGMSVESSTDEGRLGRLTVKNMIFSDTARRGVARGDEILSFAGRKLRSVNQFKNVLGIYPKGWRLPLEYEHGGEKRKVLVRLMGNQRQEIAGPGDAPPQPAPGAPKPAPTGPGAKFYKAQNGFTNFYFNELERNRLVGEFKTLTGDFSKVQGDWTIKAISERKGARKAEATLLISGSDKKTGREAIDGVIEGNTYHLDPLADRINPNDLVAPPDSGGLLMAMFQYRLLLAFGEEAFKAQLTYGGIEPFYLPPPDQETPDFKRLRVDCEVLRTHMPGVDCKWYFTMAEDKDRGLVKHQLVGCEASLNRDVDPCEICFLDYKPDSNRRLMPTRMVVRHKDDTYLEFNKLDFQLQAAK